MECPRKPKQCYCEKVEQEKYIEFLYGNKELKIDLEGVAYNKLKVISNGVIFQKIVPDVDLYNSAMLKYEENYKLYKEWIKQQRPIEIAKLQSEIDKLKKELETFNVETLQTVS
jgi:hypothetical protein